MPTPSANTPGQLTLVIIIALGFLATVGTLIFHEVPSGSKDMLEIMVGVLGTQLANVVQHYFRPQTPNTDIVGDTAVKVNMVPPPSPPTN